MAYTNATFYLDYENGSDASRTILTNVVFSNPSDDIVLGTYVGHGLVTGAVITVVGCTQAYANSTWKVTRVNDDTFTLDTASWALFTGADVTGNATPFGGQSWADAWKTITAGATAARIAPGDIVRTAKSPEPTLIGTATFTNKSTIVLDSAVNATVENCEAVWSTVTYVTSTVTTTYVKQGTNGMQLAIAASFGSGKAAYKATASELNLSGYEQLSFWIRPSIAISANVLKLCLCSDTTGDVIVDTFYIPATVGVSRWTCFTVDKGSACGASIKSIALYADSDPGTITLILDNIIVCKDSTSNDSLSLTSLIGKNDGNGFYSIQSINEATVTLDLAPNEGKPTTTRGYSGTTENVNAYKRETIKTTIVTQFANTQEVQDSGTDGNNIQFQGGYDIATSLQDGYTYFDGQAENGYGIYTNNRSYITINRICLVRYYDGIYSNAASFGPCTGQSITVQDATGNYNALDIRFAYKATITIDNSNNNGGNGIYVYNAASCIFDFGNINSNPNGLYIFNMYGSNFSINNANNNAGYGLNLTSSFNNIGDIEITNDNYTSGIYISAGDNNIIELNDSNSNTSYGMSFVGIGNNTIIKNASTTGNGTAGIYLSAGVCHLINCNIGEGMEFYIPSIVPYSNTRIISMKHDNSSTDYYIYTDGGIIRSETSVRHTASGLAWRLSPTSTNRGVNYPLDLSIAKIAVVADSEVTVKAWMRRSNTDLTMKLVCKGGQIAGVASDVTDSMTVAVDTWEELEIKFTPTEDGVVEIEAWAYGGTTYNGYVDDMSITQV